jgi:hypothetical protein
MIEGRRSGEDEEMGNSKIDEDEENQNSKSSADAETQRLTGK